MRASAVGLVRSILIVAEEVARIRIEGGEMAVRT
jgi:hypothetical protein